MFGLVFWEWTTIVTCTLKEIPKFSGNNFFRDEIQDLSKFRPNHWDFGKNSF